MLCKTGYFTTLKQLTLNSVASENIALCSLLAILLNVFIRLMFIFTADRLGNILYDIYVCGFVCTSANTVGYATWVSTPLVNIPKMLSY